MMYHSYRTFAKKLFGLKYERVGRTLLLCLLVFGSLHISGLHIEIAPFILYLMTAAFSAGVMWQALSSTDNTDYLQNMLMLPFDKTAFTFAYTGALGTYTLVTKTAVLWAVVFAVSSWNAAQILSSLLCAVNAILLTSVIYSMRKRRVIGLAWGIGTLASVTLIHNQTAVFSLLLLNALLSTCCLKTRDGYDFYRQTPPIRQRKRNRRASVWRYFLRYLTCHKNYLANSAAMCGVACVLPLIFRRTEGGFALPIGFAILSINTPLCILLSCDPALEQAVRSLPGQKRRFCIPYCIFIFCFNLCADVVFLCSWQMQIGGISPYAVLSAFCFALLSAAGSVLLEWLRPIRNWKIESDLWHHPRKYIMPAIMLLTGGLLGTVPWLLYVLLIGLLLACAVLLCSIE